jgi:HAD superfamily hydrolase (TIGR01509 family)
MVTSNDSQRNTGILFDFNGVLFWDSHLQEEAWAELASHVRGTPFSHEEMLHIVHGRTNSFIVEYLLGRQPREDELQQLAEQKEEAYRRRCLASREDFRLSPGAIPLLDKLKSEGVPFTLATSSPRLNIDFFIEHLELDRWFDPGRIVYDDGTYPGKPAPAVYQRAAARLRLDTPACVVVEDAVSGIEAARRAGVGKIIALGPAERHEMLRALDGVSAVINQLDELQSAHLKWNRAFY